MWGIAHAQGIRLPSKDYLGVPRDDHRLGTARSLLRRLPEALPLDRADPVLAAGRGACRLRGHRRGLSQEPRDHHGAALQPHEAKPWWRTGPGPHHPRGHPRHGAGQPSSTPSGPAHPVHRPGLPGRLNEIIAEKAIAYRDRGVVGLDIAGPESASFDPADYSQPSGALARRASASPCTPANPGRWRRSPRSSEHLEPDRIGHGVKSAYDETHHGHDPGARHHPGAVPHQQPQLARRVGLGRVRLHLRRLPAQRVRYTINTDGPEMLKTYIRDEMASLARHGILSVESRSRPPRGRVRPRSWRVSPMCPSPSARLPRGGRSSAKKPSRRDASV